ncbi:MAG: hypothetical protein AAGU27_26715 [Dehalobacterium sp.]
MYLLLLLLAFLVMAAWEVPGLFSKKLWRELTVFSTLWLLGFVLSLLLTLGVRLPSPTNGIKYLKHGDGSPASPCFSPKIKPRKAEPSKAIDLKPIGLLGKLGKGGRSNKEPSPVLLHIDVSL